MNSEMAEQNYLNALGQLLAQLAKDNYPKIAKKRNFEGEVLLQFTLLANGKIIHVKVANSSGKSILDQASIALITHKMQSKFLAFPTEITRKNWQIQVPIHYQLR